VNVAEIVCVGGNVNFHFIGINPEKNKD